MVALVYSKNLSERNPDSFTYIGNDCDQGMSNIEWQVVWVSRIKTVGNSNQTSTITEKTHIPQQVQRNLRVLQKRIISVNS
jgi:hypothetical protein